MDTMIEINTPLTKEMQEAPLGAAVQRALNNYISNLEDNAPTNLYEIVIGEVKESLLRYVMNHRTIRGNQSKAAKWLGISRTTLRKLLKEIGML